MNLLFLDISYKRNNIPCGPSCLASFKVHQAFQVRPSCVVVVQLLSLVQLFATPWTSPGFPVLHSLLELAQIHVHWVDDSIQPSHPLPLPFLWLFPFVCSFFIAEYHSVARLFHISPTHSPTDGNSGCFKHLAIMSNASMNIYVHTLCVWTYVFIPLGLSPKSGTELLSYLVNLYLLLRNWQTGFPKWLCSFISSTM